MAEVQAHAAVEEAQGATAPSQSTDLVPVSETTVITTNAEGKKVKKIIRRKRRPARPQIDPAELKLNEKPPPTGTTFNIWYNKWSGGDREDSLNQEHAKGRLVVAKDTGYTKADRTPGSYFCLFFARGICPKGVDCEYLHRLPTVTDIFPSSMDCFGRDKHSDYRDDMGGVGSFQRQNRTLYIGKIHVTDDIEEVVSRHAQEFGQIERIRVLTARGVAFVTYSTESMSSFAKEALAHQSFDHNEILNVRWATVDPNPAAQKREARRIEEQAAEAIRKALPASYIAEIEGRDPEQRKRRKVERSSEKADWQQAKELGAPDQRLMLEGGDAQDEEHDLILPQLREGSASNGNGILSGSTLAALKGYTASSTVKKPAAVAGPLIGYGSDDDSD